MDCKRNKNLAACTCTYDSCSRKGACCECVTYHLGMRQLPACAFDVQGERTYDRSFEHFARLVDEGRI